MCITQKTSDTQKTQPFWPKSMNYYYLFKNFIKRVDTLQRMDSWKCNI